MPRAPKRCSHLECREMQPCPLHPHGWDGNKLKHPMPANWHRLVKAVKAQSRMFCANCLRYDPKGQCDHKVNRARGGSDDLKNLQWLCTRCHLLKTLAERRYGIEHKR